MLLNHFIGQYVISWVITLRDEFYGMHSCMDISGLMDIRTEIKQFRIIITQFPIIVHVKVV